MLYHKMYLTLTKYACAVVFIACLIWGCLAQPIDIYPVDMTLDPVTEGWMQVIDDTRTPLASLQDTAPVQAGETLVFERTLHRVSDEDVVMFLTKHQEVRIFVDDVLQYEFMMQKGYEFLKTPGNEWHQLFLTEDMSGKTLRIELTSQFGYYSNLLYGCYIVHTSQMLGIQLQWLWLRVAVGAFLLGIAILSYINGSIWRGTETRRYVMLLGDFYMVLSLWVFANAGSFDVIFRRPIVSYCLEMLAVRLIPIVTYTFVRNTLSRRYLLVDIFGGIAYLHFAVTVVLQFIFGVSFLDTLWVLHAMLVLGALLDFAMIVRHLYRTRTVKTERNYLFVCTALLFISALAEVWRYYALPERDVYISFFIAIGYVAYTCIAHVVLAQRSAGLDRGKTSLETSYNKLKNTTLMRQINAHFFFNVLTLISAMCKQDPMKADDAVNLLAKYMRHYMYFINTATNIPFEHELDLVRVYLKLEQMRFEDAFSVEWDVAFNEFRLPPLSIQPVVENAVMHGLRQSDRAGKLIIRSQKINGYAVVTVQDNGAGFDLNALQEKESLAIDNLSARVKNMTNGTVNIRSKVGKGTEVKITIPLRNNAE